MKRVNPCFISYFGSLDLNTTYLKKLKSRLSFLYVGLYEVLVES